MDWIGKQGFTNNFFILFLHPVHLVHPVQIPNAGHELQEIESAEEKNGYGAVKHQQFVGTGFFDTISEAVGGHPSIHHF